MLEVKDKGVSLTNVFLPAIFQLVVFSHAVSSGIPKSDVNLEPQIYISGYEYKPEVGPTTVAYAEEQFRSRSDYQNDFVTKVEGDYIITSRTNKVVFTCSARYPITWAFPFPNQLTSPLNPAVSNLEYRISNFSSDILNPVNSGFRLSLSLTITDAKFLSVNMTCTSAEEKPKMQSSIHVYLSGMHVFDHQGKTLNISVARNQSTSIILPCRPSSPKLKLELEKKLNGNWTRISGSDKLSYDPRKGFKIVGNHTLGLYRCSLLVTDKQGAENLDKEKYMLINVTSSSDQNAPVPLSKFYTKSVLNGTASVTESISKPVFKYHIHPGPVVMCCSGIKDRPPKMYLRECETPLTCEINKNVMHDDQTKIDGKRTDCSKGIFMYASALLVCKGETIDYAQQYIDMFHPRLGGPVTNRSKDIQGQGKPKGTMTSLSKYVKFDHRNQSQSMALIVGYALDRETSINMANAADYFPLHISQYQDPLMTALDDGITLDILETEIIKMKYSQSLKEYDRDTYYQGEPLHFLCFGVRFFHARGAHIRINWKNGTKSIVETNKLARPKIRTNVFLSEKGIMFGGWGVSLLPAIGEPIAASQEMSSVECWMPARNSGRWDKISKSLQVLPSAAPEFAEKAEEIIRFKVGDMGKVITCTVVTGIPAPRISVTKDGKPVEFENPDLIKNKHHFVKLSIRFNLVSKSEQGVWQCIAENGRGTVTRRVNVIVEGGPSVSIKIETV